MKAAVNAGNGHSEACSLVQCFTDLKALEFCFKGSRAVKLAALCSIWSATAARLQDVAASLPWSMQNFAGMLVSMQFEMEVGLAIKSKVLNGFLKFFKLLS